MKEQLMFIFTDVDHKCTATADLNTISQHVITIDKTTDHWHYLLPLLLIITVPMKKRLERCKHCALAVIKQSQKFSPRCWPPSRGHGTA